MPGLNNWIDFDYNERRCVLDTSSLDTSVTFKQAIDKATEHIRYTYPNLYISLSGGIDSEFTAKCFLERGIAFTPLIVDYISNGAEVWWAYKWCYENNVVPDVIKLSKEKYISICTKYAKQYNTSFFSAIDFMMEEYVSSRGGSLLLSTTEPFNKIDCFSDVFEKPDSINLNFASYDFMIDYHIPDKHPYSFFTYIPEVVYNMVKDIDTTKSIQFSMSEFYDVDPRPKIPVVMNHLLLGFDSINNIGTLNHGLNLYTLEIGDKTSFLEKCEKKQSIQCVWTERQPTLYKKSTTHNQS